MNYFHYLLYIFLSLKFSLVICQKVPDPRYELSSTLVGTKLYFFGGATFNTVIKDTWYLDLSSPFNTSRPPWVQSAGMPVAYYFGSSCISPDNSNIYLVGGRTSPSNTVSSIYVFNSITSQWTTSNVRSNSSFNTRSEAQAVISYGGKIFIFGGISYPTSTFYNDMNIFDIINTTWSTISQFQAVPNKFADYAAVYLSDGSIIYIGGRQFTTSISMVDMNKLLIYDTNFNSWSIQNASGVSIGARIGHSAILTNDNRIIIYGGSNSSDFTKLTAVTPKVAVLDLSTWIWSIPDNSQKGAPPSLMFHCAALYNNYMIIAFGRTNSNLSNNVYIFDTINNNWVTETASTDPIASIAYKQPSDAFNIGVGVGICAIVLIGVLFCVGIWFAKRRQKKSIKSSKSEAPTYVTPSTGTPNSGFFVPRAFDPTTPTSDVFLQSTPSTPSTRTPNSVSFIPRALAPTTPTSPSTSSARTPNSGSFVPRALAPTTPTSPSTSSARTPNSGSFVPRAFAPATPTSDEFLQASPTTTDSFMPRTYMPGPKPLPSIPTTSGSSMPRKFTSITPISETPSTGAHMPGLFMPHNPASYSQETSDSYVPNPSKSKYYY